MKRQEEFVVRYTNKDIMDKLESIESKLGSTHGISKKAMWAAGTALTLTLAILGLLLTHLGSISK